MITVHPADDLKRLRVLHVVHSLDPGGMENGVVNLANILESQGVQTDVCCLHKTGAFAERLPETSKVHVLGKQDGVSMKAVRKLASLVNKEQPDVVHTHNIGALTYAGFARYAGAKSPILHGEHGSFQPRDLLWRRLQIRKLLYRQCSAVHTVSHGLTDELKQRGFDFRPITTIVNGVDTDRFCPPQSKPDARQAAGLPGDAEVIGIVGRFIVFKRHDMLIDAFDHIATTRPKLYLIIVGAGGDIEATVRTRAEQSPHKARIIFTGHVSDPEEYYRAMDLLAAPSEKEGMSNAVLEAMACATPVIAADACGNAEILEDSKDGILAAFPDAEALAKKLTECLDAADKLERMGQAAREKVVSQYSPATMGAAYLKLYREVGNPG